MYEHGYTAAEYRAALDRHTLYHPEDERHPLYPMLTSTIAVAADAEALILDEPPYECTGVVIKRKHGRWHAVATWFVGPAEYTREHEGADFLDTLRAVTQYQPPHD